MMEALPVSLTAQDSLCMMPLNALNDKMFLGIWFWFIILACITALSIAYGVCYYAYHMYYMRKNNAKTGDIFVLSLIKQNVCHITFGKILEELEQQIESKKKDFEQGLLELLIMVVQMQGHLAKVGQIVCTQMSSHVKKYRDITGFIS